MKPVLFADVGGTETRLALWRDGHDLGRRVHYRNSLFPDFYQLLSDYLGKLDYRPATALIAAAGPVAGGVVRMTNLGWELDANALASRFDLAHAEIINDFEALAWATLELGSQDLWQVGGVPTAPGRGTRAVLGPGTGLGVAGLLALDQGWAAISGEGGHVSMPAMTARESVLIDAVRAAEGHCSAERLLSGAGLTRIAAGLGYGALAPEAVTRGVLAAEPVAVDIMQVFSELLGTVAADLALTLGARGGVFIAGGILPRVADWFAGSGFRRRFEDKGRCRGWLEQVPAFLITAPDPAFRGLMRYWQQRLDGHTGMR